MESKDSICACMDGYCEDTQTKICIESLLIANVCDSTNADETINKDEIHTILALICLLIVALMLIYCLS